MLSRKQAVAALLNTPQYDGANGIFTKEQQYQMIYAPPSPMYSGKVVVLIHEWIQSSGEHACLYIEAGTDATFIGSPTSGANGNITAVYLPGGIEIRFTGMEVRHGDGRQLQRLGIQPHIEVRPTIEGLIQGRDEFLERAVKFLKGETATRR